MARPGADFRTQKCRRCGAVEVEATMTPAVRVQAYWKRGWVCGECVAALGALKGIRDDLRAGKFRPLNAEAPAASEPGPQQSAGGNPLPQSVTDPQQSLAL